MYKSGKLCWYSNSKSVVFVSIASKFGLLHGLRQCYKLMVPPHKTKSTAGRYQPKQWFFRGLFSHSSITTSDSLWLLCTFFLEHPIDAQWDLSRGCYAHKQPRSGLAAFYCIVSWWCNQNGVFLLIVKINWEYALRSIVLLYSVHLQTYIHTYTHL